jgi:arylsulfatase
MGVAPMIAQKSFDVEVQIEKMGNGILVAQGGDAHGWALTLKDGILHFFIRLNGKMEKVSADQKLDKKDFKFSAKLNSSGDLILYAGNRVIGKGKISSLVKQMPLDGLQVGKDESGLVGDYKNTFVFDGKIKRVKIKIN